MLKDNNENMNLKHFITTLSITSNPHYMCFLNQVLNSCHGKYQNQRLLKHTDKVHRNLGPKNGLLLSFVTISAILSVKIVN